MEGQCPQVGARPTSGDTRYANTCRGLLLCCWGSFGEQVNRGVFQTGGFPFYSGKVLIVSRTLLGMFLQVVGPFYDRPSKSQKTVPAQPPPRRELQNLWGSAGGFRGRVCIVENLLPHAEPQKFGKTLRPEQDLFCQKPVLTSARFYRWGATTLQL